MRKNSIGLVEFKTVPVAVESLDVMLKAASVDIVFAAPVCPGKYVIIVAGDVSAVQTSVTAGVAKGDIFCLSSLVINNIHPAVFPALSGVASSAELRSLGLLESISAITAVRAADVAAKAATVDLIDVRLARGLGGKSYIVVSGEVSSVKTAIRACETELADLGDIVSTAVISQPHPQLRDLLH